MAAKHFDKTYGITCCQQLKYNFQKHQMMTYFHPAPEKRLQMCVNPLFLWEQIKNRYSCHCWVTQVTGQEYKYVVISPGLKELCSLCVRLRLKKHSVLVVQVKPLLLSRTSASSLSQEELNWPFRNDFEVHCNSWHLRKYR